MPDPVSWNLSTAVPVALLPVRLEVRFFPGELRVRIYPDDIHVDTHEPGLTTDELEWGKRYWRAVWRAAGVPEQEKAAWEELAGRHGPERAAWVARVLEPRNPGSRPPTPTPEPAPFPTEPSFPPDAPVASSWTRAAVARGLPVQWQVTAYPATPGRAAVTRWGAAVVPRALPVGPAPGFDPAALPDEAAPVDPSSRWMVDFGEAENLGMGVRLPRVDERFTRVTALGVVSGQTPAATAAELDAMLEAHYHTTGVEYVPPGAPSNNTATAASLFSRTDPDYRAEYAVRHTRPARREGCGGTVLATALGLPVDEPAAAAGRPPAGTMRPILRARNAGRSDAADSRSMITALWGATWGYFLSQMTAGYLTDDQIQSARAHARSYLRPGGPLPALRVGRQPYGVLPVLPLALWADLEGDGLGSRRLGPAVVTFLQKLRSEVWEPSLKPWTGVAPPTEPEPVPRVGRGVPAGDTIARILGMAAVAQRVFGRSALGSDYVAFLWRFAKLALSPSWRDGLANASKTLGDRLGLGPTWNVRLGRMVYATDPFPLPGPLVNAAAVGGDPGTYLGFLGGLRTATELRNAGGTVGPQTPLLSALVRHSLLAEHAIAVARLLPAAVGGHREPELVDVLPEGPTPTLWRRLAAAAPGGSSSVENFLRGDTANPATADLREAREAVTALAKVGAGDLERLMGETLDATSHRLDAWITSFATRRLSWMRRYGGGTPQGLHLGGYGWVTDVAARVAPEPVAPKDRPAGETDVDLVRMRDSAGFVHAPSPALATTAAVLRAGHRAHGERVGGPLALDLPGHRLRAASWILDAVRGGRPLGALLGYRFERALQQSAVPTLPAWIDDFRRLAPMTGTLLDPDGAAPEAVADSMVVDGLTLHRLRRDGRLALPAGASSAERAALDKALDLLDDTVDAVADALLAEGVHHAVLGNPLRAGATVDAMSRGEAPPPELEIARTPRTGVGVTHRVLVAMPSVTGSAAPVPGAWPVDELQVRAPASPAVNAWLAQLLPSPARVRARVTVAGAADPGLDRLDTDLVDLRLSPLDYLALIDGGETAAGPDLEARLRRELAARPEIGPAARLTVDLGRDPAWPRDVVSVAELLEALRGARDLLRSARPVDPVDLDVPEAAPAAGARIADPELEDRANRAWDRLTAVLGNLQPTNDVGALRQGMRGAAAFGVPDAVVPAGTDETALRALAAPVLAEVTRRRTLGARTASGAVADRARLRVMFGPDFPVTNRVTPPAGLATAVAGTTGGPGVSGPALAEWLERTGRVRAGTDRLCTVLSYAEVLGTGDRLGARVAQLPYVTGERWLGLGLTGRPQAGSRVSLVIHPVGAPAFDQPLEGLVVDEWTEVIPSATETTGVAVHIDSPNAAAPQAILLAVPPDGRAAWTPDLLLATVDEAFALAQLRAVDADALHPDKPTEIGQIAPATFLAMNLDGDAVSTDPTAALPT